MPSIDETKKSMTSSSATSDAPPKNARPPAVRAFYTPPGAEPRVELWITANDKPGAPTFDGSFGKDRVAVYVRRGSKGTFLALTLPKDDSGRYPQLGTANLVSTAKGEVRLVVKLDKSRHQAHWINVSSNVPHELLASCGLDLTLWAQRKAAAAAARTTAPSSLPVTA